MAYWSKLKTQWLNWEFWPFWAFYIPVYFYFIWLALRSRSFFFFSATNPRMEFGGMIGEKKSEIFKQIPDDYYPKTILISSDNQIDVVKHGDEIGYPLIAKPDIGERGRGVELIKSQQDLEKYTDAINVDFLLQEYVDFPVELGVFYIRHPDEQKGVITSLVSKEFFSVTGNGESTIQELLKLSERGSLQIDLNHPRFSHLKNSIPKQNQRVVIEEIGNHCRGTKFLDATDEIDEDLCNGIDTLAKSIPQFYYGRFDLRCRSIEDLKKLEHFKIVELNGVGAEPAHIYNPGFPLVRAYKIVLWHFRQMASIARKNKKNGTPYWTHQRGIKKLLDIRAYNKRLTFA